MDQLTGTIKENLEKLSLKIEKSKQNRVTPDIPVQLVAVSKFMPVEVVRAGIEAGLTVFGENYPEETAGKIEALKDQADIQWHMIGHLQSRKADIVAENFNYIHSIDSLKIAERLSRLSVKRTSPLTGLLEINVSGETSKGGWAAWDPSLWPGLLAEFNQIIQLPGLKVKGLMTMPPFFDQAEMARPFFQRLRAFSNYLAQNLPEGNWSELSMGTSGDFEVAIEEGATFIRIGQAIFGPRPSK